jgi:cell division protein FtsX
MAEHRAYLRRSFWRLICLWVFIASVLLLALNVHWGAQPPSDTATPETGATQFCHGMTYFLVLWILIILGLTGIAIWTAQTRNRITRLTIEFIDLWYAVGQLVERQEHSQRQR